MNIDQLMFLILLCFSFLVFLYLLGCEDKENTILNEYSKED